MPRIAVEPGQLHGTAAHQATVAAGLTEVWSRLAAAAGIAHRAGVMP